MMCTPRDFAKVFVSLKAPRGLTIHRLEVKYQFFVHPNINKTNRIKENNSFLKICHGVDLFRNSPYRRYLTEIWIWFTS